jgi:SAM-dependent methyltransferase
MTAPFVKTLIDRAAAPYRAAGRFAWHFARGKLGGDPVFAGLLMHGLIPDNSRILDIGCGQGLLASWLLAAKAMQDEGLWPARWSPAPNPLSIHGIEIMARDVERAQRALSHAATFTTGDMCRIDFGTADVIVMLDVLHYVSIAAQNDVLQKAREALSPGGTLILRVGDAGGGLRFKFSVWTDYVASFVRGHRNIRLHCRALPAWYTALADLGFTVSALPMNKGTPFANVLLVAKLVQNTQHHPGNHRFGPQ